MKKPALGRLIGAPRGPSGGWDRTGHGEADARKG